METLIWHANGELSKAGLDKLKAFLKKHGIEKAFEEVLKEKKATLDFDWVPSDINRLTFLGSQGTQYGLAKDLLPSEAALPFSSSFFDLESTDDEDFLGQSRKTTV
ncbi:MAG: hypothetical protein QM752_04555 [Gammaproteobacteria bacterium]